MLLSLWLNGIRFDIQAKWCVFRFFKECVSGLQSLFEKRGDLSDFGFASA